MNIDDVVLANRYLDDELDPKDKDAFEKRLETDSRLREYVRSLKTLIEASRDDEELEVPPLRLARLPRYPVDFSLLNIWSYLLAPASVAVLLFLLLGPAGMKTPERDVAPGAKFRVVYFDPQAHSVAVAGSFNNWSAPFPLSRKAGTGYWAGEITVPAGKYQYVIVIDKERWIPDPTADYLVKDDFGSRNSVVKVGM